MNKILCLFYTRTGKTKEIIEYLSNETNANYTNDIRKFISKNF